MAVDAERDQEATRRDLATWLRAQTGASEVEVGELTIPGLSGFSNETILFDALLDGELRPLVVRVEPTGHQVFPSTAFDAQAAVMRALGSHESVPVPEVLWFEEGTEVLGARFLVMARIAGEVPPDNPSYHAEGWLAELPPDAQRRVWENGIATMAAVNRVDRIQTGLEWVRPRDPVELLQADRDYQRFACGDRPMPVFDRAFAVLEANVPEACREPALCWGDSRVGNIIFGDDLSVAAVLDWEMVTAGDPVQDLAWYLLIDRHHHEGFGIDRLPGLPDRDRSIALWETVSDRSAENLGWYEVLAGIRYAAIMTRVMLLLDHKGVFPGAAEMAHDHSGVRLLERILDEGS